MAFTVLGRAYTSVTVSLLLVATSSASPQPPAPSSQAANTDQLTLTPAEEKDSYEIYSILLRKEMPPAWNITGWAIAQEAHTFPDIDGRGLRVCIQPPEDQKSIYLPLIEDYIAKNKKKLSLKRKFDLPEFALVGPDETTAIQDRWPPLTNSGNSGEVLPFPFSATVIFQVSAVGFNSDRTRALVYVGHRCGGLCGGGTYHLMVKKDGKWQGDREYRGGHCSWAS